ncbi:hypothetical protein NDU88_004237 [Pleurodeles waltl]|uniref:Uncharacterized protein n=1 Tax=Pleurodeles waltl TaxID=8319 RepID=A0AAV7LHN4_PLEWA|nr:hypothetical protein NDU88_004237 [Pleurodeles waltl]
MRKEPRRRTDDDRTFWELLLEYTKRLRAVERPGRWGVQLGCRAREEAQPKCRNRINWPPQPQRNTKRAQSRHYDGETEATEGPIRGQPWGPVAFGGLRSTAQSD